jgi:hypothetical protein
MNPAFAQASPGGGGGDQPIIQFPTVDWSTLVPQLVNYFFDAIGRQLNETLHSAFDGVWSSGSNVLGQTDLAMTWGFGPVAQQVQAVQGAARVVLVFALIVLGLRGMLSSIMPRQPDMLAEFINGVAAAVIMVAAFPLLVPQVIDFTNQAANAVGRADLSGYLTTGAVSSPVVELVVFVILLFFALRLLIKAVWRIGFLAVLLPVGIFACAMYALPQLRWILGWWLRVWGGMLLAQIPSVFALSIGAQLFAHGGGLGAFVYSIAFLQLASDVYNLIPFGSPEAGGGPPWAMAWPAHVLFGHGTAAMGGLGAVAGGIAVAAGGAAAGAASSRVGGQTYGYQ